MYSSKTRQWSKKSKIIQTDEKIYHILGLKESIPSKWQYCISQSIKIECNSYQITNGIFHGIRTKKFTIFMKTQKTLNRLSRLLLK